MILSEKTINNIHKAHFVRGIEPTNYLVIYKNIFELLQYRNHLQPDENFITFYSENNSIVSYNYCQLISNVFQTANFLKSLGIKHNDRIATVSHNHINTVIQYFAAWALGAVVIPINVNEETERIEYILKSSYTKLAFVNYVYYPKFQDIFKKLSLNIVIHSCDIDQKFLTLPLFETEIQKFSSEFSPDESINQESEALIVYTSGTTGLPKGVVLTHYNLLADAYGISKWHKISKGTVMMCVLPIHHVNGTVVTLMTPMFAGGSVILNQKFHTNNFFDVITKEKVNIVSVVPTLLHFLCYEFETNVNFKNKILTLINYTSEEENISSHFSHFICGAGPLTVELVQKFEKLFNLKIIHGYGLSETTCYSCFIPIDLPETQHRKWLQNYGFPSIGIPIETNEMDIHSADGNSLPENSRGEIVIRGHNVMKFYDNNVDANDKTFEFGWFRSGDEGFYILDEFGNKYFFITGRIKELIIRGGVNIAPLEIDEILMKIPEIKSAIAVGFDNDWYGEEVGALVMLKDGILPSDEIKQRILKFCYSHLPFYKSPKVIVFSDSIPVTATGKYQRNKVKYLFNEFKSNQFK